MQFYICFELYCRIRNSQPNALIFATKHRSIAYCSKKSLMCDNQRTVTLHHAHTSYITYTHMHVCNIKSNVYARDVTARLKLLEYKTHRNMHREIDTLDTLDTETLLY